MLKNILVATDASPASNRAINLAADMAGKYGATLHLIYAVREMQLPPELKKMAEVEKIAGARSDVLDFVGQKILGEAENVPRRKGRPKSNRLSSTATRQRPFCVTRNGARSSSSSSEPGASVRSRECSWAACRARSRIFPTSAA